ncbi:cytosine methyltransferase [Cystobacter fuscus]|uniref:Cytosine-specific methyltransferase n=1 Tax=Cystobacter fuscus TaxID=43 RepID=A0A250JCE2_9BACT|nr:DNA cytosine methyltransferase [Cystobacter fuscus]ATB41565.1 cytosine methyltransferase [Cystobacter fuscus]
MSKQPKIISLYSGAGGLDYGFEAAGFDTAVAVEFDKQCCETLRRNRRSWRVVERSIFDVPTKEILKLGALKRAEVDLVIGGPPCQPFSKSAYWVKGDTSRLDDPRADTLAAYMQVIEEALPKAFLLENVGGLAFSGKDEGLKLLLDKIERINKKTKSNYVPYYQIVNAANYGVPQLRERFILVASREGLPFNFPSPTHGEPQPDLPLFPMKSSSVKLLPYRTAWDAIADVRPALGEKLSVQGKWAALLPSIPEGQNYLFHTDRGGGVPLFGWRRRYWQFLLKLAKNRPSWTIQAQPGSSIGPFHWENRRLSAQELCRLQTIPDDIVITGGRVEVQRQIGNAVPSLLAEVLARAIRTQLLELSPETGALKLMPPDRSPAPPPNKVEPVPDQYLHLKGDHAPHPGTGKGEAALARARKSA